VKGSPTAGAVPRGGPPPGAEGPFVGVLAEAVARTAPSEGHESKGGDRTKGRAAGDPKATVPPPLPAALPQQDGTHTGKPSQAQALDPTITAQQPAAQPAGGVAAAASPGGLAAEAAQPTGIASQSREPTSPTIATDPQPASGSEAEDQAASKPDGATAAGEPLLSAEPAQRFASPAPSPRQAPLANAQAQGGAPAAPPTAPAPTPPGQPQARSRGEATPTDPAQTEGQTAQPAPAARLQQDPANRTTASPATPAELPGRAPARPTGRPAEGKTPPTSTENYLQQKPAQQTTADPAFASSAPETPGAQAEGKPTAPPAEEQSSPTARQGGFPPKPTEGTAASPSAVPAAAEPLGGRVGAKEGRAGAQQSSQPARSSPIVSPQATGAAGSTTSRLPQRPRDGEASPQPARGEAQPEKVEPPAGRPAVGRPSTELSAAQRLGQSGHERAEGGSQAAEPPAGEAQAAANGLGAARPSPARLDPTFPALRSSLLENLPTLRALMAVAIRAGSAAARISLSPPSLGALRITVTQSAAGLTAHLLAESPQTVRLLQASQAQLRATLEELGLPLLSLEIGAKQGDAGGGDRPAPRQARPGGGGEVGREERPTTYAPRGLTIDLLV